MKNQRQPRGRGIHRPSFQIRIAELCGCRARRAWPAAPHLHNPTTSTAFAELVRRVRWVDQYGELARVGMEGTGSYGAGFAQWLRAQSITVIEVDRPDRRTRRRRGKSDWVDAEAAARAVLAGTATAQPKAGTGPMEMVRTLRVARQSALKARTQAANELHALVVTAPEAIRAQLRQLRLTQLVKSTAAFRLRNTQ